MMVLVMAMGVYGASGNWTAGTGGTVEYVDVDGFTNTTNSFNVTCGAEEQEYNVSAGEVWSFSACDVGCEFPYYQKWMADDETWCTGTYYMGSYNQIAMDADETLDCNGATLRGRNGMGNFGLIYSSNRRHYTAKNCILDAMNESNYAYLVQTGDNITLTNMNISGSKLASVELQGVQNSTVNSSFIGEHSYRGLNLIRSGTVANQNNIFKNLTLNSKYRYDNTDLSTDLEDGIHLSSSSWNTFEDITLIDWGHSSIYILGATAGYCSNNNTFNNILIQDTVSQYNRGLNIDGNLDCAANNSISDVVILDTTVRSQVNGNDNNIFNITIENVVSSSRTGSGDIGQAIDCDVYTGGYVSQDNLFEDINIINTEHPAIRVASNVTNNIFRNLKLTNIQSNEDILFVGTTFDLITIADFANTLSDDGILSYNIFNSGSGYNITINETSTQYHYINFSNRGIFKAEYNGRKDFDIRNTSVKIEHDSFPTLSTFCYPNNSTCTQNLARDLDITMGANQFAYLYGMSSADDPYLTGIATTITDYSMTYTEGTSLVIDCTGSGQHNITNLDDLIGAGGYYQIYYNGVFQSYSSETTQSLSGCSTWEFRSTSYTDVTMDIQEEVDVWLVAFSSIGALFGILILVLNVAAVVNLLKGDKINFKALAAAHVLLLVTAVATIFSIIVLYHLVY